MCSISSVGTMNLLFLRETSLIKGYYYFFYIKLSLFLRPDSYVLAPLFVTLYLTTLVYYVKNMLKNLSYDTSFIAERFVYAKRRRSWHQKIIHIIFLFLFSFLKIFFCEFLSTIFSEFHMTILENKIKQINK